MARDGSEGSLGASSISLPPTSATRGMTFFGNIQVFPAINMTALAMRHHHFWSSRKAALDINLMGYWLKVGGIDTGSNPAKVVEFKAIGDRAATKFISNAVSKKPSRLISPSHTTVSVCIHRTKPHPTPTLRDRHSVSEHCFNTCGEWFISRSKFAYRLQFGARNASVALDVSLRDVSVSTGVPREKEIAGAINRFGASDNRPVIGDIRESHEIGSFDQVVRGSVGGDTLAEPRF